MDVSPEVLAACLARDPPAVKAFVRALTPVIQVRVGRALLRRSAARAQGRDPSEEVRDLTQEVFAYLFADDAKVLRAWTPARGLSLANFVGLIAEHQVVDVLRSGRRRPWSEALDEEGEIDSVAELRVGPEGHLVSRQYFQVLLERVQAALTPRGYVIFQLLYVEEKAVDDVIGATGLSADAVYAWRSRLPKLVRKLVDELDSAESLSNPGGQARKPREEVRGRES